MEFARYVNTYLNDYIRHADAKAGAVFLVAGAMLGYLVANVGSLGLSGWSVAKTVLFCLAVVPDVLALLVGLWIVFPRLYHTAQRDVVFWEGILEFKDSTEYVGAVLSMREQEYVRALCEHSHTLARVAREKYRLLRWAFGYTGAGCLLTFLFVILY